MNIKWPDFMDLARFAIAMTVFVGGGFMVYIQAMSAETFVAIAGVVLGFYFGSATSSTVTKAATTAATDAVTRSLEERGIK